MLLRTGHRLRWFAVWGAVAIWFVALVFGLGGNAIHLLLLVAGAVLLYELMVADPPPA